MTQQNAINSGARCTPSDSEMVTYMDTRKLVTPASFGYGVSFLRNAPSGTTENLSMSLSGGVLSFIGFNGSAISTTNPAYVTAPSKVFAGRTKLHQITSGDLSFNESELTNNLFGTTDFVAWGSSILMPFYVYVVANDADASPVFAISRVPHLYASPSVANSGKPSSATADTDQSFWYLDDSISLADYDGNPCVSLGSFSMSKSSANVWTITVGAADGFGNFNESVRWTFPDGQGGAASGKYLLTNGGTAPTFTAPPRYEYSIKRNGLIEITCFLSNTVGGTPGAGAVEARLTMPFRLINGDLCVCRLVGSSTQYSTLIPNAASPYAVFNDITAPGTTAHDLSLFSTVLRIISFGVTTQIPIL